MSINLSMNGVQKAMMRIENPMAEEMTFLSKLWLIFLVRTEPRAEKRSAPAAKQYPMLWATFSCEKCHCTCGRFIVILR